jgi:hypothetical protein
MNKPYKNQLQEYYQKLNLEIPVYNSYNIKDNNNPVWRSDIVCNNKLFSGIAKNKKDAENNAAKLAFESLDININIKKILAISQKVGNINQINIDKYNKIILVDGENCDINSSNEDKISNSTLVLIFVSKNTIKKCVFQLQDKYENYFVFISESVGRDAADHLLTFYAGKLSVMYEKLNIDYYIFTKDHYGEFIEKFMENCKFICSIDYQI